MLTRRSLIRAIATLYQHGVSSGGGGTSVFINNALAGDTTSTNTTGITINNVAAGGGGAHAIVQPTIVCNYIINAPGGQTATGLFCFSEVLCKAAHRRHLWTR